MSKTLIIAEKPSVAKNIAEALKITSKGDGYLEGDNYIITWAFGHLLELYDAKDYDSKYAKWKMDNFPFIPSQFKYKVKSNPRRKGAKDMGANKQLKTIGYLMNRKDVEAIISACDYDREGQLIGDSIINELNPNKRVYRLLLNEWTQQEVLQGLERLCPNEKMRPLSDAGLSRQWADWVIGINLTSVATLKYQQGRGKALNIGRVLLPTLKIIYDRDKEIKQFVPEDYYKLVATFQTEGNETFEGTYVEEKQDKFKVRQLLEDVQRQLVGKQASIMDKHVEKKKEFPPLLFNLSNLQGYITNRYKGWTSDKVLKVAQSLYEKKLITYPRTASMALEESLVGKTAKVLDVITEGLPYKDEIRFTKSKRVFNNAKVESHSAIIPTYIKPRSLTPDQKIVYEAIKNRLIMQFMPVAEYEETRLLIKVSNENIKGGFVSKGKVQLVKGWKKVEDYQSKDVLLPSLSQHEKVHVTKSELTDYVTKPPKHHTEKTLLRIMETCGKNYKEDDSEEFVGSILSGFSIGTPATRAETIKKLKNIGYITFEGKYLLATELGQKLVETFPVKELFDLQFTGRLEKSLSDIEKNKVKRESFLEFVFQFTTKSVAFIKDDVDIKINKVDQSPKTREILGKCPQCGGNIIEGTKGFGCSNWKKGCTFVIWKNDKFLATMKKKASKTMVKTLLKNNVVFVKGLTSKKGKKFNAYLRYQKNSENPYFSWKMDFHKPEGA
ncbi:type IA DNA topoisomerase [Aquibacillus kalidii]|uniref:type IA DNA topoisomerase n=1 Tax=Aquibacillus kalidii TaxID=2762597 RepID=UPI0016453054|nr:type IA DNA topoisomerase [Aquibacillus kalidii]